MQWSKLKQRVEERFASNVRKRVSVQATRYRDAHDEAGEVWVAVDGDRIHTQSEFAWMRDLEGDWSPQKRAELSSLGKGSDHHACCALFDSLSQTIDDMLASPDPLTRGLAVLDTRCGKRRLSTMPVADEHLFVQRMHALRSEPSGTDPNA